MSAAGERPAELGERFALRLRLGVDEIPAFAASVRDFNPLHHDAAAARAAGYPGLIACGPHLGGIFMGMTATHFVRTLDDGRRRSGLGLGFDLRFRKPVFPDEDIDLQWRVDALEPKPRLAGWLTRLEGEARSARGLLIGGSGTLLLRIEPRSSA